ncbi:predicted protein [Verticillium alfalfae VaMs.102]|uniref:Predicted protein n=1 Tax=Verticillium alfalfae (strain VaMs.102 / ATCC MYA-4576 / FGSC 10136) TaxID=526221 RepID=C9SPB6_VERA1|nr:predicted protein [Verticillium alfalfae VaMs.102]EEY20631.1 predicted protein [Verticillium alfalfae VaMs.102]
MSFSRAACSSAALSRSSRSLFSALSLRIFSISRCSSASSSSLSSSLSSSSSSSSASSSSSESASISRVSSSILLRLAAKSSSSASAPSPPPPPGPSKGRFDAACRRGRVGGGRQGGAVLLGGVRGLGSEELGGEITRRVVVFVGGAALASLAELELGVGGQEPLVVGRAAEGLLAAGGVKGRPVGCGHVSGWRRW